MLRKDRVFETLRSMCTQRPAQSGALRRYTGFSAEEVAELAQVDRTNASRDLNVLVQEGLIERIPGRPVLFTIRVSSTSTFPTNNDHEKSPEVYSWHTENRPHGSTGIKESEKLPAIAASVHVGVTVTSFDTLIGSNEGLKVAVQQAKAAILYPPRGLHTLLYGPSGVGKTTLARLMYAYALELKALPPEAAFVSFNCADYANNPQLLMAHLFGVVRGAYTGAERDREGLVEQAHRGILFLDEVHRLPPEGQEMLFYLIDRERFRRLGDVNERHSSLLLLAATTEEPATTLLPTFRRRIPMIITLPGLNERTVTERYELLRAFFTTECSSIGTNIHVEAQVLHAFLLYDCPGNVGQLRTDVQLTCARAYLEYRTHNLPELNVHLGVLPDQVRRGLLRTVELHRQLAPMQPVLDAPHIFTPTGLSLDCLPESAHDLYNTISTDLHRLRRGGLPDSEINRMLHLDIQNYFQRFAQEVSDKPAGASSILIDERMAAISRDIVAFAEEQLGRVLPEKLALVLAMHLTSALEHIEQGSQMTGLTLQSVRRTYPVEYEVARSALTRLRSTLGVSLPESETDVLAVLLANAEVLLSDEQSTVGIVVAAHGRGIAAGLAELANTLVGVNSVRWVELTLDASPEELLHTVIHWVQVAEQGSGVLLFVDFSSLLSLGELISRQTGIEVRALAGVSAPLLVEAARRAQHTRHLTLDQLAVSLTYPRSSEERATSDLAGDEEQELVREPMHGNGYQENSPASIIASKKVSRVILSVCLTGFGSATKIAELIEEHMPGLRQQGVEIICMDISLSSKSVEEVQRLVGNQHVVAVVGTINPHIESYPFIALTDFLFGDGVARLRTLLGETLIDPALLNPAASKQEVPYSTPLATNTLVFTRRADLLREISYTLSQRLLFLNPVRIMPLIERMIELIEVEVGETFEIEVLAGLILHLACILERATQPRDMLVSETVRTQVEQLFARELSICRRALHILSAQIARSIPDEEAYNIVGILRQVDIFIVEGK
ncbi:MAG TPA: sigma 54-interacting transcriptional regulator [Ktedonobacteraceae bacterium]|nr:sigma 54-interacting transcriptional regulator [Ktedonobacteraceae bacterium]